MKKITYLHTLQVAAIAATIALCGCEDKFAYMEDHEPEWLGANVYDYLAERGDCHYFCQLIEDCGYYETMKRTGSNTLFFSPDSTFERYFASNEAKQRGITSYETMPQSLKYMLLRSCMIENSQLIERLSVSDHGGTMLRRKTLMEIEDSIPLFTRGQMPNNFYFQALQADSIRMLTDRTDWTLVQLFPEVCQSLKITDDDMHYVIGKNADANSSYLFQAKIVKEDITCKNGYLHELDRLCTFPENMGGYIRSEQKVSDFNHLMERFCEPVLYRTTTNGERIYELRYFNESLANTHTTDNRGRKVTGLLYFDPGWNLYEYGSAGNQSDAAWQKDMAAMFVPTNEAMEAYFCDDPEAEGYDIYRSFGGNWDQVPDNICADIVKNHQMNSFVNSTPSHFGKLKDMAGYEMEIEKENIVGSYVARNGMVYLINKVLPPLDYRSVMGPVKVDQGLKIFNLSMGDNYCQFQYYLRSLKSTYNFFVTPDSYMQGYTDPVSSGHTGTKKNAIWDFRINANTNSIEAVIRNANTGDSIGVNQQGGISGTLTSRLTDILNQQTVVGELTPGREWYITKGYAPLHIQWEGANPVAVAGAGNKQSCAIIDQYEKTNGYTRYINGILQTSTTSIYSALRQHAGTSATGRVDNQMKRFYDLCEYCGLFEKNPTSTSSAVDYKVGFLNQYHYAIYVPTNAGVDAAIAAGVTPTIEEIENCELTSEEEAAGRQIEEKKDSLLTRMKRFIRYHFQDYAVYVNGEVVQEEEYLTSTLNEISHKFYPLFVTQNGTAIQLLDYRNYRLRENGENYETVNVSSELYNLCTRDLIVNSNVASAGNAIETYSYGVIHLLEEGKYLRFE